MVIRGDSVPARQGADTPLDRGDLCGAGMGGGLACWRPVLKAQSGSHIRLRNSPLRQRSHKYGLLITGLLLLALGTEKERQRAYTDLMGDGKFRHQFLTLFAGLVLFSAGCVGARP